MPLSWAINSFKSSAKGLLSLLFFVVLLTSCIGQESERETQDAPEPPKVVSYLTLGQNGQATAQGRVLSGQVFSAESTRVSFESSGKIGKINAKLGDDVKKGQVLAEIDTTNYRLRLNQAQAQYTQTVSQRNQAQSDVNRRQKLVKSGAVSRVELDMFKLQLKTAQEAVNVADAAVKMAKKQLGDTTLRAPFSGTITQQLAEVGQLASPQVPIFTIATDNTPEIGLSVPENLLSEFSMGRSMAITFPALSDKVTTEGTVSEISSQASLGAFPVRLKLQKVPPSVKPGMTAEITLTPEKIAVTSGFAVPPSALAAGEGQTHFVYRIKTSADSKKATLERINVTLHQPAGDKVMVSGNGLQSGDKVVRVGVSMLDDKQEVELMNTRRVNP